MSQFSSRVEQHITKTRRTGKERIRNLVDSKLETGNDIFKLISVQFHGYLEVPIQLKGGENDLGKGLTEHSSGHLTTQKLKFYNHIHFTSVAN
jgi:hypothetical protein